MTTKISFCRREFSVVRRWPSSAGRVVRCTSSGPEAKSEPLQLISSVLIVVWRSITGAVSSTAVVMWGFVVDVDAPWIIVELPCIDGLDLEQHLHLCEKKSITCDYGDHCNTMCDHNDHLTTVITHNMSIFVTSKCSDVIVLCNYKLPSIFSDSDSQKCQKSPYKIW